MCFFPRSEVKKYCDMSRRRDEFATVKRQVKLLAGSATLYNFSQTAFRKRLIMNGKFFLVFSALACLPLMSQEVSAGITGRVTDPSGSAIVGASVTARDMDRQTQWPAKT